jgi:hypothetical protein
MFWKVKSRMTPSVRDPNLIAQALDSSVQLVTVTFSQG